MQTLICNMQTTHVFAKPNAVNAHKRLLETIDVDKRNRKMQARNYHNKSNCPNAWITQQIAPNLSAPPV